jgi:1-aminocyclopropane-1-carboxylate synthase
VRLPQAMATHLNEYFHPISQVDAEEITFAAGVTELNETCALTRCDEGDAVMLAGPSYVSFNRDLTMRTGYVLAF